MALIASRHVAARLGIKTGTLAKWRSMNLGPQRWIYLSPTLVVYSEGEVDASSTYAAMSTSLRLRVDAGRLRAMNAQPPGFSSDLLSNTARY
jgi:hypothetical protein